MSAQQGSVRKRKETPNPPKAKDILTTNTAAHRDVDLDVLVKAKLDNKSKTAEWDFRIALAVITLLAFLTRFWGISHPNEVVFDEVHFGKVSNTKHQPNLVCESSLFGLFSLLHIISNELIFSMSTHLSGNSCSP